MKNKLINFLTSMFTRINRKVNKQKIKEFQKKGLLKVGVGTYGINNLTIDSYRGSESKIEIGKYCSIGPDVRVITGGIHPVSWVSTYPFRSKFNLPGKFKDGMPYSNGDIFIGNDVWIGTHVIIMSGVKIGDGCVIASGSIVTANIEPYSIVGGVPARVIKKRFSDTQIDSLLDIRWWDKNESEILDMVHLLNGNSVELFIKSNSKL